MHLLVLPIEEISDPRQAFQCTPYHAKISAGTCVERQQQHGAEYTTRASRHAFRNFGKCANCAVGRIVAARIGVELPARPRRTSPASTSRELDDRDHDVGEEAAE